MGVSQSLQKFFSRDAHCAHFHGNRAPLKRPGLRTQLAVLGAALTIFAATAVSTPAAAQDKQADPAPAVEQVEDAAEQDSIVTNTNPDDFKADVIEASKDGPLLLYIHAPGCGHCEDYGPILEMEAQFAEDVQLVKLNIDEHPEFTWGSFEDMQGVPFIAVYAHGYMVQTAQGAPPAGQEFEAAQGVINYARNVWQVVGDQLDQNAPGENTPAGKKQPRSKAAGL